MEPILKVEHMDKAFGGVIAAQDVNFTIMPGQIMGLIGPNGAGKTTTLNLISGIYACDKGSVYLNGKDVTKLPAHTRARMGLARTFQTPRFLQRSSIRENLMLGLDLADQMGFLNSFFGRKGNNFEAELNELMAMTGFTVDWDADINSLPYGQRKMLEIVRSLLTHPKIILVDEPAAGLNGNELERVLDILRYAAGKGVGIVLIEHQMDFVMNISDFVTVLNFGRVLAQGTPEEVATNSAVIEAYLGRDDDADN